MSKIKQPSGSSEMDHENILEVRNASVTFDMERGESRVLNGVDIDIRSEEILGIVGESGSGKSMFASALLDAIVDPGRLNGEITYYPEEGGKTDVLELSDEELRKFRWEEVSMVFQGAMSSFNPTLSIREHFEETLKYHGYNIESGIEHAREILSDLFLEPDRTLDSYPHELSGGMSQRALIALSIVLKPNVLVMDEPTAALDLLMQRSILNLLADLQDSYELTVIFITHDLPLVAGLADRLAVMYAFEFVELGHVDGVIDNPTHPYTRHLLQAVPNLDAPLSEMRPIEGDSPDPVNVPSGCSYHPRCPMADETCVEDEPSDFRVEDEHYAACFHWENSEREIPLSLSGADDGEFVEIEGSQSEEALLSLDNLQVHFEQSESIIQSILGDPELVRAVDGVDLDIYENDVVAIVGESGCGKTTLGKAVVASQRPTTGSVSYRGQDVWEAKNGNGQVPFDQIRKSLQVIHQDPGSSLNPNKIVRSILSVPLNQWHPEMGSEERLSTIHNMLDIVGLQPAEDYAERYPHQLSGGEKQRVALIRALLLNPELILADEAVSALDVSLRVEMMDLMLELQDMFDTSYLFISHNLSNARYLAGKAGGRIGVMYLGEIVEIGPAEQIVNNPKHPYTQALKWSAAELKESTKEEEAPIRGIDIPDPVDPPSGCKFHTRCPEAREACTREEPELYSPDSETGHGISCFRDYPSDHDYWDSPPISVDEADQPEDN